jgi:catechol 2,3-dioxygenase-like lactoylglutathione lyase family enzyme
MVIRDPEASLAFYRDTLGFELTGEMPMPGVGTMYRMKCGDALVKLIHTGKDLPSPPKGGLMDGLGYRYFTIHVENLADVTARCQQAGYAVPIANTVIREGVTISLVSDPDGNLVEFLNQV